MALTPESLYRYSGSVGRFDTWHLRGMTSSLHRAAYAAIGQLKPFFHLLPIFVDCKTFLNICGCQERSLSERIRHGVPMLLTVTKFCTGISSVSKSVWNRENTSH